jgi:hypothetical protein
MAYRRRDRRWVVLGIATWAAVLAAAAADRLLTSHLEGGAVLVTTPLNGQGVGDMISSRVSATASTTILFGDSWPLIAQVGLLVMIVAVAAGSLAARFRPGERGLVRTCGIVAVVGAALPILGGHPDTIPSLFAACPLLLAGLLVARRRILIDDPQRLIAAVALVYCVAVLVAQYDQAGAAEWGARYLALVLPMLVPLALHALRRAGDALDARTARRSAVALVVVTALVSGYAVWALHYYHGINRQYADLTAAAAADQPPGAPPVVVTTWIGLGRLMWPEDLDVRGLTVPQDELHATLNQLRDDGVRDLTFVTTDPNKDLPALAGLYDVVATRPPNHPDTGPIFELRAR